MRTAFGEEFDVPDGYLNTASIGIPSRAVAAAVDGGGRRTGAPGAAQPADHDPAVEAGRAGFAALAGVPVDRVAVGASVSSLVGLVAAAVPDGGRVLVAAGEFTSVTWPFAVHAGRGVDGHRVRARDEWASGPAEFDVVAVSVVQSADGRLADLDALRAARAARHPGGARRDPGARLAAADARLGRRRGGRGLQVAAQPARRGVARRAPGLRPGAALHAGWYAGENPWTSVYGLPLRLAARRAGSTPRRSGLPRRRRGRAALARRPGPRRGAGALRRARRLRARAELGMAPAGSAIVARPDRPGAGERLAAAGVVSSVRAGRRAAGVPPLQHPGRRRPRPRRPDGERRLRLLRSGRGRRDGGDRADDRAPAGAARRPCRSGRRGRPAAGRGPVPRSSTERQAGERRRSRR